MRPCTTTREAFDVAILSGDLETVQAYFAQRHVRDDVRETNAIVINSQPTVPRQVTLPDGRVPWFRQAQHVDDLLLRTAARRGHSHILEWLFSHKFIACMRETLAFLLPLIAEFDSHRFGGLEEVVCGPFVMETLLTSPVFCEVLPAHKQQALLDRIAEFSRTPSLIRLAIAHGARVQNALPSIAQLCTADCVSTLQYEGALLVGADVVQPPTQYAEYPHVDAWLASGIDRRGPEQLLIEAAADAEDSIVDSLLSVGCIDVDARDGDGRTALMRVASVDPWEDLNPQFFDPTPFIAEALLKYCDVNAVDDSGWTALHYAVQNNHGIAKVLLAHGADPNLRDENGNTALECMNDYVGGRDKHNEMLRAFLVRVVDPFEIPPAQEGASVATRSFYDRLVATPSGAEFIQENPQYFQRSESKNGTS